MRALAFHRRLRGKISIENKTPIRTRSALSLAYTPGVGAVSTYLKTHPRDLRWLTIKNNTVAVVSDGSAVLGLGNLGPEGALPVLEGKCMLFKELARINAFPLALATQDVQEIVATVKHIAPVFGGINLEDISAPRCFEIEEQLKKALAIPVMHDDQHGTAIVVLAALMNAARVVRKRLKGLRVVVSGAGPAGVAVTKLLVREGIRDICVLDSGGILGAERRLVPYKNALRKLTNPRRLRGGLEEAIRDADVFIGVSRPHVLFPRHVSRMARHPIVFALANPVPEIMPDVAKKAGAAVVATGRSDFSNQINNALAFPGIFRGALDRELPRITDTMKVRAAHALAGLVRHPTAEKILPSVFDEKVVPAIARSMR